jgi:ATP-dependent DNA ligase
MKERSGKAQKIGACFIEPMLCLAVEKLPEGPAWQYEVKLDGYRAIGVKTKSGVELWSRNKRDLSRRFLKVARALGDSTGTNRDPLSGMRQSGFDKSSSVNNRCR